MVDQKQYKIEILDVTLNIIEEFLTVKGASLRPSELARRLNINRTRVYRVLKTLEQRGYVEADEDTQAYHLGIKFLEVGAQVQDQLDSRQAARPVLMELAQTTGDVAQLLVRYKDSAVCIDRYQGDNMLQVSALIGHPLPLYVGASPKILLAYMPAEEREKIIQNLTFTAYTPNTITDPHKLRDHLELIRQRGYEVDEEDYEIGTIAIGAPIFSHQGAVLGSITVTTPSVRYGPQRRQELIHLVCDAAQRVSAKLGYYPNNQTEKKGS